MNAGILGIGRYIPETISNESRFREKNGYI